jgi:acetate kinase
MKVLVLNSGSSSQKTCLYEIGATLPEHPPACLWEGKVEFGGSTAAVTVKNSNAVVQKEQIQASSREDVVKRMLNTLTDGKARALASLSEIDIVGHRVVHGGPHFAEPVAITPQVRSAIASVLRLAPLHIPATLEGMEIVGEYPGSCPTGRRFRYRILLSAAALGRNLSRTL